MLFSVLAVYVSAGKAIVKKTMTEYLNNIGYVAEQLTSIEVNHSFMNTMLSYNEWTIKVVYADEPEATYMYTLEDGEIKEAGVTGDVEKTELKHLQTIQ